MKPPAWRARLRLKRGSAGGGTDHGTAGPSLVLGGKVRGGLHGESPNLTDLEDGDLKFGVDFRSIYATIADDWMHVDATAVLGGTFDRLPLFD